jgi:hypothetical protein
MEELLLLILQGIWEIFWDLLLQSLFQLAAEILIHAFHGARKTAAGPYVTALGYTVLGGIAGLISLLLFPHAFIRRMWLRIVNMAITPLIVAELMTTIGRMRIRKGQTTIRLDTFSCAYIFALAMALVRFGWAA